MLVTLAPTCSVDDRSQTMEPSTSPPPPIFLSMRFLVSRKALVEVEAVLMSHGADVVTTLLKHGYTVDVASKPFDFAVVAANESIDDVGTAVAAVRKRVRGSRIPVMTVRWVLRCVEAGEVLPPSEARDDPELMVYDPNCLAGFVVTSSDLAPHVKRNVRDVVTFFGGAYSPNLLSTTDLVIAEHGCVSLKVNAARRRENVSVAPLSWLESLVRSGRLPPQGSFDSFVATWAQKWADDTEAAIADVVSAAANPNAADFAKDLAEGVVVKQEGTQAMFAAPASSIKCHRTESDPARAATA